MQEEEEKAERKLNPGRGKKELEESRWHVSQTPQRIQLQMEQEEK